MFGGNLANDQRAIPDQRSFYYSGVGTYGNKIQKIFNAGFSPENLDVRRIIKTAGADLAAAYETGDQIFIFGFNRGTAIARRFASVIDKYIDFPQGDQPIRFLGVFDTVASIGFPNLDDDEKPKSDVVFEDHTISPHIQEALHLVSADERRIAFLPTLMNKEDKVTEIWFAGAHADVGGGFWFDGLSDVTLKFMLDKLQTLPLGVKKVPINEIDYGQLKARDSSYRIDKEDMLIKPNYKGKTHQQDRFAPIAATTLDTRLVRVNVDDDPSEKKPLVHQSVEKRIVGLIDYRPRSLKGITHDLVDDQGKVVKEDMDGVWGYIHQLDEVA